MTLIGQTALVTGAGRGIGRAIADELAARGCHVAVAARTAAQTEAVAAAINNRTGGRARSFAVDVRDHDAVSRVVTTVEESLGPITLLVNNAGTPGPAGHDWEVDPRPWWECVESIVRGAFNCSHVVVPGMLARGSGRIVNIASITGTTAWPLVSATSVAKTALIRLTENLATACCGRDIGVFALHPGIVRTELLESYRTNPEVAAFLDSVPPDGYSPPELVASVVTRIAAGELDGLSGRFVDATGDIEHLIEEVDAPLERDALMLRISRPTGPQSPTPRQVS